MSPMLPPPPPPTPPHTHTHIHTPLLCSEFKHISYANSTDPLQPAVTDNFTTVDSSWTLETHWKACSVQKEL